MFMLSYTFVHAVITQSSKTYVPKRTTEEVPEQKWIVPLTFSKESRPYFCIHHTKPSIWLTHDEKVVLHGEIDPNKEWIIFNVQATGYYRVNYYPENWHFLTNQLTKDHKKIHLLNRAQLIDDAVTLAIDNYISFDIPIKMMTYMDKEDDLIPWLTAMNKLEYLYFIYESQPVGRQLQGYIYHRIENIYSQIGFHSKNTDDHLTKTGREQLVTFACWMNYQPCIEDSRHEFLKSSSNLSRIQPDVKRAVLCTSVSKNSVKQIDLWNLYRDSNVAYEKETALWALGCTKDEDILKSYLYKLINVTDNDIRLQDYIYVYRAVFRHPKGVTACLNLIKDLVKKRRSLAIPLKSIQEMTSMIYAVAQKITSKIQNKILEEVLNDFTDTDKKTYENLITALKKAHKYGVHQLTLSTSRAPELELSLSDRGSGSTSAIVSSVINLCAISATGWLLHNKVLSTVF